jgi:hypothetical protein
MIEVYAWLTGPDGWAGIPLPLWPTSNTVSYGQRTGTS